MTSSPCTARTSPRYAKTGFRLRDEVAAQPALGPFAVGRRQIQRWDALVSPRGRGAPRETLERDTGRGWTSIPRGQLSLRGCGGCPGCYCCLVLLLARFMSTSAAGAWAGVGCRDGGAATGRGA